MRFILFLLAAQLLVACKSDKSQEPIDKPEVQEQTDPNARYAWVDDLRVRKTPDKKAEVVAKLQEGDKVEFLNEASEHREDITMRGVRYVEPWLKIVTPSGDTGWAFGGGLKTEVQLSKTQQAKSDELEDIQNDGELFTIYPGQRLGMLRKEHCLKDLRDAYGKDNVKAHRVHMGEGEFMEGHVVLQGGLNEFALLWKKDSCQADVVHIYDNNGRDKPGPTWKLKNGIGFGTTLKELVLKNGAPITFAGFEWDYAGNVNGFNGGRLERELEGVTLFLVPNAQDYPDALVGDVLLKSNMKEVQETELVVNAIFVNL